MAKKTTNRGEHKIAPLIKADTALQSFRDGGYQLGDAIGELVDNPLDSGAKTIHILRVTEEVPVSPKSKKTKTRIVSFAVGDDGTGIPPNILADTLTVGFSTRYNSRGTIGRFGVGFKLASISQCRRIEVYTRPRYLTATKERVDGGKVQWTYSNPNEDGRVFRTYMDLKEIEEETQEHYAAEEVDGFPAEYASAMEGKETGTLVVWKDLDRLNNEQSYSDTVEERIAELRFFLRRAYRRYIANGVRIFFGDDKEPLAPYDPTFQLPDPVAERLADVGRKKGEAKRDMRGVEVETGEFLIDGHAVRWGVFLTPEVTRLVEGGGGSIGPNDLPLEGAVTKKNRNHGQFQKLYIPENEGKLSFLRRKREISYTTVPRMLPGGKQDLDRYIGIEIDFPAELDEYFQVRHIKRGAEPVEKLRTKLRDTLKKPVTAARKRIREVWKKNKRAAESKGGGSSGSREKSEATVQKAAAALPTGRAGKSVDAKAEEEALLRAASQQGITTPQEQEAFVADARRKALVSFDTGWPGTGLLDIEHLNSTVVVKINSDHPFIRSVYAPLQEALADDLSDKDAGDLQTLLTNARDAIDLLFFAYAKAENMHDAPESVYLELREDWGKFAAVYLREGLGESV